VLSLFISQNPVQEWGEEVEDGAIYGITLRREPVQPPEDGEAQSAFCFVQYRTYKVRRLKAATLDKLTSRLLEPGDDPDFAKIFLATYRAFTDTSTLIDLLLHRYRTVALLYCERNKQDDSITDVDSNVCHVRPNKSTLIPLIQMWLEEYAEDFRDPPHYSCLKVLRGHLRKRLCYRRLSQRAETLLKKFQDAEKNGRQQAALGSGKGDLEQDCIKVVRDFLDFPSTDIAEQLTLLDAGLFMKVLPFQCMGCIWSQRDKKENKHLAPTIRATIAQFNMVTNCVISTLLCQPSSQRPCDRARVVEKWIEVAQECKQLKNFSSLRAILSALQSNAVYRLKKTWASVSRESMTAFEQLCQTFPDENCALGSREILMEDGSTPNDDGSCPKSPKHCPVAQQTSTGNVPYLGTFLTVLTMLDTALPDTVEGGLINFEKRRREFEVLSEIRQLQAACSQYSLSHHPCVSTWLQSHRPLTDQESYDLSRQLEPPVDTCPGSPGTWSHRLLAKKLTSLLTVTDGSSGKTLPDQISVSSSGSSGSEMEDVSSPHSPLRGKYKPLSSSCQDVAEEVFSPTGSSCSSSSCNSQPDLPSAPAHLQHRRSISMNSLPVYNRQVADCCVIRVSVDNSSFSFSLFPSPVQLTSQEKTAQVVQRALEKHNLESSSCKDFSLSQVLSQDRELVIPDKANVFYAMCTSANYDFILRRKWQGNTALLASPSSM
uniref:Ral guanine nucleotide dissociation stimulator-like 3a n=1 Tax=Lepisosteus oculatus TaxID=7918 RepID=W5MNU9_LEPOC